MEEIRESVAVFGRFGGLVGILGECNHRRPEIAGVEGAGLPGVIILNTGIIHRVGIGRLSTLMARRIARAGHCVLRFDLSGIGDSERRGDLLPPIEAALADVRDAVDWLESARGISRVILIGLCSGADLSLVYAGNDPRVCGIVIVDPTTPKTRRHYLRKLLTRNLWKRQIQAVVERGRGWRARSRPAVAGDLARDDSGGEAARLAQGTVRDILCDAYRAAFAANVRALAIFTTGAAWYNYRRQLFDAFPEIHFDGNLQLEYFERCDHAITHEENRARLFGVIDPWLKSTEFKPPGTTGGSAQASSLGAAANAGALVSVEI